MSIVGTLSISNAVGLSYPFPVVISNLSRLCDSVLVGVDPNFKADLDAIKDLGKKLGNINVALLPWNRNRTDGREIAIQLEAVNDLAWRQGADWVVSIQADELFLEEDFSLLRGLMHQAPLGVIGFSTQRTYFWGDFETVRADWNADLIRIFRAGTHSFLAENTDKSGMFTAPIVPGEVHKIEPWIYHYSRMGDPKDISKRIRNADTFFHEHSDLVPEEELEPYGFVTREYDNYSTKDSPLEVKGRLCKYAGPHPQGIIEWYNG